MLCLSSTLLLDVALGLPCLAFILLGFILTSFPFPHPRFLAASPLTARLPYLLMAPEPPAVCLTCTSIFTFTHPILPVLSSRLVPSHPTHPDMSVHTLAWARTIHRRTQTCAYIHTASPPDYDCPALALALAVWTIMMLRSGIPTHRVPHHFPPSAP
jgi:hypothetical protein